MFQSFVKFYQTFVGAIALNLLFLKIVESQYCVDSRLRAGQCVALNKCPGIIKEFYDDASMSSYGVDFQTFVSNSICGFDGKNLLICCRSRVTNQSPLGIPQFQNSPIIYSGQSQPPQLPQPPQQPSQSILSFSASPTTAPTSSSNVFLFAPLGSDSPGYLPPYKPPFQPPTIGPYSTPAPWNNWPDVVYSPSTAPSGFIWLGGQALTPTTATISTPSVFQPVPQPTALTSTISTITQVPQQGGGGYSCGINRASTNRVVGGTEARRGSYPWIAALGFRDDFDPTALKFLCGASLISSTYVITSGHCINANLVLVRLGAHDITNSVEPNARDYRVKRSVVHESFDLKSISDDIALVELMQPVVMTNFINPICLPESASFLSQEFVGMNPFIAGWGAKKHQGTTSKVLLDAQVPIVSRQTCEQNYRNIFNFVQFSDKLICAGNSNADACQGDSGGPLMLPQMIGGRYNYYLIGVVSYGYECARVGYPGVYTRVAAYMPWIKRNMI